MDLLKNELPDYAELDNSSHFFDPVDYEYLYSLCRTLFEPIIDCYFRTQLIGFDRLPENGPFIVASNHSGNAFPYDAMVLDAMLWRKGGMEKKAKFRSVFTPKLTAARWMRPFGLDNWWRRGGGVDMTFDNFDLLLKNGHRVLYYPEGVGGIGKGFTRRYQLQHFYSSFVVLASKYNVPVCPVYTVNAEWVNPASITVKWLDRIFDKLLGLPFFPVPAAFFALLFPFLFYLAFPCKMIFVVGQPVNVREKIRSLGIDPNEAKQKHYKKIAGEIRRDMQQKLNKAVSTYGRKPYDIKEWWQKMKAVGFKKAIKYTPLGWPVTFIKHARDLERPEVDSRWHALIRDVDILAYYLPFGWLLAAFFRKIRKPPYGYRGLTKEEQRMREGKYLWLLKKHPIPGMKI